MVTTNVSHSSVCVAVRAVACTCLIWAFRFAGACSRLSRYAHCSVLYVVCVTQLVTKETIGAGPCTPTGSPGNAAAVCTAVRIGTIHTSAAEVRVGPVGGGPQSVTTVDKRRYGH